MTHERDPRKTASRSGEIAVKRDPVADREAVTVSAHPTVTGDTAVGPVPQSGGTVVGPPPVEPPPYAGMAHAMPEGPVTEPGTPPAGALSQSPIADRPPPAARRRGTPGLSSRRLILGAVVLAIVAVLAAVAVRFAREGMEVDPVRRAAP
jgi:hypothetical protein